MIKIILDDYRYHFREAVKENMLKLLWLVLYGYFELMIILELNFFIYTAGMIPILMGALLSEMYPNQMRIMMFLCPLTEQDRKEYMKTAYRLRICIPVGIGLLFSVPAVLAGKIRLIYYFLIYLLASVFLIGVNLKHVPIEPENQSANKKHNLDSRYAVLSTFLLLIALTAMSVVSLSDGILKEPVRMVVTIVLVIAEMILCKMMLLQYYETVMALGIHYEKCHPGLK